MGGKMGGKMRVTSEKISPAIAEIYLARNYASNRNIRKRHIDKLAIDMSTGNYEENNPQNAIVFDTNGVLKDGQHRLMAIKQSGVTLTMFVWRDVPDNVHIFDRAASRKTEDVLVYGGMDKRVANCKTVAVVNTLVRDCYLSSIRWSDTMVGEYLSEYGDDIMTVTKICGKGGSKTAKSLTNNSAVQAASYCALRYGMDVESIKSFMDICATGIPDEAWQTAPILLRRYITDQSRTYVASKGRESYTRLLFKVTIKALADFEKKVRRKQAYIPEKLTSKDLMSAEYVRVTDAEKIKEIEGK